MIIVVGGGGYTKLQSFNPPHQTVVSIIGVILLYDHWDLIHTSQPIRDEDFLFYI